MQIKQGTKNILLTIFTIIVLIFSLTGCQKDDKKIIVGTNPTFPPFEYVNETGEADGFDIALIKAIGEEQGYDIEVVSLEFKSLLSSLQTGGIDIAVSGMTITEDRKKSVNFSEPYYKASQSIIVPIESEITCLSDLNGKKIAVQEGTTGDLLITPTNDNKIITDSNTIIKRFKKGTDAVLELKNNGVAAVVIDTSPAMEFVKNNSDSLKLIEDTTSVEEYGIAVAKEDKELLKEINEGLEKIKQNGTYYELYGKYFEESIMTERKSSDNIFIDFYYDFMYVFVDTNGYELLLSGLCTTILISLGAVLIGVFFGLILAFMCLTEINRGRKTIFSVIASAYIDVIRGTPVMVQLLIMYMVVFQNKFSFLVAVITFGLNSSAYISEIIRSGIMSIDKGQMEGGRSLGFNYIQTMRYIIIPQAIKVILPTICNEFIALIKETSIVGYIAVQDLTKASDFIISRTYETFMPLLLIAVTYYIIIRFLSKMFSILERRLRKSDNR